MFQIDKGIPMPPKRVSGPDTPFSGLAAKLREMEIGDSIFVETDKRSTVNGFASTCFQRTGLAMSVRKVEGGYRIWRTA